MHILTTIVFIPNRAISLTSRGYDNECAYDNLRCTTECASELKKNTTLMIAVGVISALFMISCICIISFIVYTCNVWRRNRHEQQLPAQQPPGQAGDNPVGEPQINEGVQLIQDQQ